MSNRGMVTPSSRVGSSTSGRPWSRTAPMMAAQPTPRSRATAATAWACLPARFSADGDRDLPGCCASLLPGELTDRDPGTGRGSGGR
jgi:hypothetical protein